MAEEEKVEEEKKESLLVPQERYLEAGVHIGTRFKTIDMKPFIFKMRDDGLYILDLRKIDERIRLAAKMLGKYKPEEILVVASRLYSANAAKKFSDLTGVKLNKGRFVPGSMTNIALPTFVEPKIILVCDPKGEGEAVREAAKVGVPVVALCDSDNLTNFVDLVVPTNNKGRKALGLIFYMLARELQMSQGKIKSYDEFQYRPEYFERFEEEPEKKAAPVEKKAAESKAEGEKKEEKAAEEKKPEEKKEKPAPKKEEAKAAEPKKEEKKAPEAPKEEKAAPKAAEPKPEAKAEEKPAPKEEAKSEKKEEPKGEEKK